MRCCWSLQDASAARALDRQLAFRSAARSVTGMAAILAHEVKNPLSGIRGAAQLLETSAAPPDRELTVLIRDEADRIRALVDRMETFGEKPLARTAVNIHRVMEHVRKLAQNGFAAHGALSGAVRPVAAAGLGQPRPAGPGRAQPGEERRRGDRRHGPRCRDHAGHRLPARHAHRRAGHGRRLDLPLLVAVRDNGPGIPEDIRAASVRAVRHARKPSGSGLGLALVAKIIGDHGGLIEVDSRPGRTEFRLHLPVLARMTAAETAEEHGMTPPTVLIADDDRSIRTVLTQALGRSGYQVRSTGNAATLWRWVEEGEGDLVITDVVMPDENGLDLIPRIRRIRPDLRVIVMSAQSTLMTAVKATQRGAFEYLPKPFDLRRTAGRRRPRAVGAAPAHGDRRAEPRDADERLPLIGRSPAMQEIYRTIARLTTADLTVMINGESGTGKELVARALHDYGKRRGGPFVAINMAAIPRELIESELFGHERGAFTGAHQPRSQGRFEQANGGTLFLDEIGDMPPEAQTRLLRVLQEGEFTSVGGRQPIKANVRIIAATHRDLRAAIRQGQFREDLFYRLNVVPIRLPPLRERAGGHPGAGPALPGPRPRGRAAGQNARPGAMDRLKRIPGPAMCANWRT